jgi:hypothetical protein
LVNGFLAQHCFGFHSFLAFCTQEAIFLLEITIFNKVVWYVFPFFKIYLFFFYLYVQQCLGHFSPLPPTSSLTLLLPPSPPHPLPLPSTPSLPGRNYFALISNFVKKRL